MSRRTEQTMGRGKNLRGTLRLLLSVLVLVVAGTAHAGVPTECVVADNGSGTVNLPPEGCDYLSPQEVHMIIDGLPPGTTIELDPIHGAFFNPVRVPGGNLGGEIETFDSFLFLDLQGTGDLTGFNRNLEIPIGCEVHTGPRNPGDPVQDFDNEMVQLQGALFGDPDFDVLTITGGSNNGLPGPGHTTLTRLPFGDFQVDSFFDITYMIDFVGAPGSILEGMAGSTTATVRMGTTTITTGNPCEVVDNGSGTVELPPAGCDYLSPQEVHQIIDGLPPGTTIELAPIHSSFFCHNSPCGQPGGSLGGESEDFDSLLELELTGTGLLKGFQRQLFVDALCQTHTAPRNPGDPIQTFDTDMFMLQGQIFSDPDFAQLFIVAGTGFGLPSPGQTTLTRLPTGDFNVDSFFDITYQIDFVGAPGSILEGFGGSTVGTTQMVTGQPAFDPSLIFADGFESGDTTVWSSTTP